MAPGRPLLLTILLLALVLFAAARIGSTMLSDGGLAIDHRIMAELRGDDGRPMGPRWLLRTLRDLTTLGGFAVLILLTALVTGWFLAARRFALALFVPASIAAGAWTGSLVKAFVDRPRPDRILHLVETNSASFPSAHAMNGAIVYLTLGVLLARTQTTPTTRAYVLGGAVALTALIGMSRVYLGVHWTSDVIAGWAIGAAWALASASLARRF